MNIYENLDRVKTTLRRNGLTGEVMVQAAFHDATGKGYASKRMKIDV